MRVAIRADASTAIGLGHVRRCLSLAHALRATALDAEFVIRDLGLDVAALIRAAGFPVHVLPPPVYVAAEGVPPHAAWAGVGWQHDADETAAVLGRADWVIVDHYAFDARWHRAIAASTGARIAVIDELADRSLSCHLVVDHTYAVDHRSKFMPRLDTEAPILGGPTYALLGPAYSDAPRHRCRPSLNSIGIFMGGADAGDYTTVALDGCRRHAGFEGSIEIVSTRSNARLAALQRRVEADGAAQLTLDLPDLSAFFARHDLQVGAGGGATWERCCIGAPTISMVVAENQRAVLEPLRDLGVLRTVEPQAASIGEQVLELINDSVARCALAQRATRLVDGQGAARVARYLASA